MRFTMSGQTFEFRPTDDITADEFWIVDELLGPDSMEKLLYALADGLTKQRSLRSIIKELCVAAYLGYRREGGRLPWADFSRTISPGTLEILPSEAPPGSAEQTAPEPQSEPVLSSPVVDPGLVDGIVEEAAASVASVAQASVPATAAAVQARTLPADAEPDLEPDPGTSAP